MRPWASSSVCSTATVAAQVFEILEPTYQQRLLRGLRADRVVHLIEELDPDDRVRLLDEVPAKVANRLLASLSPGELALTSTLLGYPEDSAGRLMSPEFISLRESMTVGEALAKIRRDGLDAETIYALPVLDDERHLIGVTGLRALVIADRESLVADLMNTDVRYVSTHTDQEVAARLVSNEGLIALPVVDAEERLVGVLTVDDAMAVLEEEESEDMALQGGRSPAREPYLAMSVFGLARTRALWLLVLIVAAALTVNVLQIFEDSLARVVALALFIPLLIDTGGNCGSQASTSMVRALAVDEVRPEDLRRVVWREATRRVHARADAGLGSVRARCADLGGGPGAGRRPHPGDDLRVGHDGRRCPALLRQADEHRSRCRVGPADHHAGRRLRPADLLRLRPPDPVRMR